MPASRAAVVSVLLAATVWHGCRGERVPGRSDPAPAAAAPDGGLSVGPDAGPAPARALVRSSSDEPLSAGQPELAIDRDAIRFNGVKVVEVHRGVVVDGPGAAGDDYAIPPLVEALDGAATLSSLPDPMLTIFVDPSTRYTLFLHVISSVRRTGFGRYQFPVKNDSGEARAIVMDRSGRARPEWHSADAEARSLRERVSVPLPSLTLVVRRNGFLIFRRQGPLPGAAPGPRQKIIPPRSDWRRHCSPVGAAEDPRSDETYRPCALDFEALRAGLAELHAERPDERALTFAGLGFVEWETLVAIMDAARESGGRELYPSFVFVQAAP